jgi:hypothetical protein
MKRLFAFVGALLVAVPIAFAQTWPYFPPPGTGSGTSGQCLISGGAGVAPSWLSCSTGAGTVTSVALADASSTALYVISGSPVTTSGTLTETLATESPNFVLAGPASGVTAVQPTFRPLVNADIPTPLSGIAISGAAGSFTTLAASSTVSGTGFSTYLASPPAIGGTAPAAVSANNLELAASQSAVGNGFYNGAAGNQVNVSIGGSNIGDFTSTGLNSMAVGASTASTGAFTTLTTTGSVGMTGAVVNINASSNFNTNINTGSSTGSVVIGNTGTTATIYGTVSINASNNHTTAINTGTSSGTITIGNSSNTGLTTVANMAAATVGNDYVCATTAGVLSIDTTTCGASDEAFKEKIKPLTCHNNLCIDEVMKLQPVSFHFKASYDPTDKSEHIGFLAQDMEKVEPRLVAYDAKGKPSGVDYAKTSALLAKGEQDLQAEVVALKAQNAALAGRLAALEHPKKMAGKAASQ